MKRTRINPINRKRKAELHARNFGDEAEAVRMLPCLACARERELGTAVTRAGTRRTVVAAHVTARGMGGAKGGRFDLVPLCDAHHREAGEARTSEREAFETRYGLDLRAEADRLAAAQAIPLGICGLARRLAQGGASFDVADLDDWERPEELSDYERDALLGWVRREMARHATTLSDGIADYHRPVLLMHISNALGLSLVAGEHLCEAAGWPEVGHE